MPNMPNLASKLASTTTQAIIKATISKVYVQTIHSFLLGLIGTYEVFKFLQRLLTRSN